MQDIPSPTCCRKAFLIIYKKREKIRRLTRNISQANRCIDNLGRKISLVISNVNIKAQGHSKYI